MGLFASLLASNAAAVDVDSLLKAVVRIDVPCGNGTSDKCWGTGAVVRRNPVVVATCYHVVAGQLEVRIHSPKFDSWVKNVVATSIAAYPESDIAFLRIGPRNEPALDDWYSPEIFAWPTYDKTALHSGVQVKFAGASNFDYPNGFLYQTLQLRQWIELKRLGGPTRLDVSAPKDFVAETLDGTYPGDSGAPVIDSEGTIVGLVAGAVKQDYNSKPRWFAVPPVPRIPTASSAWKTLPVTAPTIFRPGLAPHVTSLLGRPSLPEELRQAEASLDASIQACLEPIGELVHQYAGHLSDLPEHLESAQCDAVYQVLRPRLLKQDELEFTAAAKSAEALWLEQVARQLEVAENALESSSEELSKGDKSLPIAFDAEKTAKARRAIESKKVKLETDAANSRTERDAVVQEMLEQLKAVR
jgi:hypothetical protein